MNEARVREVTEEYLKTHMGLTHQLQAILELLYREGIGDANYKYRGKKLGRGLRPAIREMIADALCAELVPGYSICYDTVESDFARVMSLPYGATPSEEWWAYSDPCGGGRWAVEGEALKWSSKNKCDFWETDVCPYDNACSFGSGGFENELGIITHICRHKNREKNGDE